MKPSDSFGQKNRFLGMGISSNVYALQTDTLQAKSSSEAPILSDCFRRYSSPGKNFLVGNPGENYRFGYKAAGDASELVKLCEEYGLGAYIVSSVVDRHQCIRDKGEAKQ
ncbi:hypothetical protein NE237_025609 [Protea cynaroides]|uniref:FAD synthase n=1 Tax=Protea cynaroides TaxID=273540 RepID=A0A9Q0H2N8_9MAGN|nr:hypothetical protein NE237_025609 [Protea cynaroides]